MSEEWIQATLGACYELITARREATTLDQNTPYFGLEHLAPDCPVVVRGGVAADVSGQVTTFQEGDTLFGRLRPYLRKVAFAGLDGVCSPEILVLRPRSDSVEPRFLQLLASSERVIASAIASSAGSRMPRTAASDLAAITILRPPLPAQRRIVDLMAHLDDHLANLRAEREFGASLLAQLREALSAASDPVPLGELAAVDGIQIGPFGSQLHASEYVQAGIPVVMPRDITEGQISSTRIKQVAPETAERLSRHQLSPGDIVFPRRGDLSKRALVTAEQANWLCGTGCIRFRPALGIDGGQIFQALSGERATAWLVEHAVGTTMLNLNTQILTNLPVPDPRAGESPVAAACEALAGLLATLAAEESELVKGRGALLSSVLSGAQEIEATYDTLLPEAS